MIKEPLFQRKVISYVLEDHQFNSNDVRYFVNHIKNVILEIQYNCRA